MYRTFYLICLIVEEGDIFYLLDSLHSQTLLFGKLVIILNSYRKLPGRIAHSQVFPHFARFQESQPVISPRRHVYVTMVRETMLDYYPEIICTALAEEGNGEEVPGKVVLRRRRRHDESKI